MNVKEGHGRLFPITGLTFQVRKVRGGGWVGGWLVWVVLACRNVLSAPVPVPFLWILDLGLGFGTWLWDLDLGLGLDLTIIRIIIQREDFEFMCWQVVVQDNSVPAPVRFGLLIWVLDLTWVGF